ncbi:hypothetical protein GGF46_001844 [Coemansia sp. RSA 552]|nr:hypothetical protein GGF46_001844 [Coemansia sp. RSA 552]
MSLVRRVNRVAVAAVLRQQHRSVGIFAGRGTPEPAGDSGKADARIAKVSRGLSGVFQGSSGQPEPVDPYLEVVDSGHGSLLRAKLPPFSSLITQVGQTVGQSPSARSRATPRGTFLVAALRPLLGRSMYVQEITTEDWAADVLISPKRSGDVVVLGLNGMVDYFVRRNCLLAQSRFIDVKTWSGIGATFNALAFDRAGGRGSIAVSAFGGLHRLVLAENEQYLVDPRYVVAWSATLDVAPQSGRPQPLEPKPQQLPASSAPHVSASTRTAPLVSNNPAVDNTMAAPRRSPAEPIQTASASTLRKASDMVLEKGLYPVWRVVRSAMRSTAYASVNAVRVSGWAAAKTTRTLAGVPDLYRVSGPGEIYISTRLSPRPWTRITETIAAKSS